MRIPPSNPTWLTNRTLNCHLSTTSSCSLVCLFARLRNSQTLLKFTMIMNSFADFYVYINIFSLMEMPTNNLCTTTAVKLVRLNPMAETALWILLSITLETSTTISFLTHHIALSPTFLGNNKKPLENYPTTLTL